MEFKECSSRLKNLMDEQRIRQMIREEIKSHLRLEREESSPFFGLPEKLKLVLLDEGSSNTGEDISEVTL